VLAALCHRRPCADVELRAQEAILNGEAFAAAALTQRQGDELRAAMHARQADAAQLARQCHAQASGAAVVPWELLARVQEAAAGRRPAADSASAPLEAAGDVALAAERLGALLLQLLAALRCRGAVPAVCGSAPAARGRGTQGQC
jgi:hypothetical protein